MVRCDLLHAPPIELGPTPIRRRYSHSQERTEAAAPGMRLPEWCRNEDKDDQLWKLLDNYWAGPYRTIFSEGVIAGFMQWKVTHFVVQDDDDDDTDDEGAA